MNATAVSKKSDKEGTNTSKPLPQTDQEWDAAMKSLVAIIEADYDLGSEGRWLGFAYETGLVRIKFPSGNIIVAQAADAETAIESMREIAIQVGRMAAPVFSSGDPYIRVHRVPANCMGEDGLNQNVPGWLASIGLEIHAERAA